MSGFRTVELGSDDADDYVKLYRGFEWWADRDHSDVEHALENTPLAVGLRDGNELVAAARVFSDFVYYAKIYDVIVAESRRGEGFGTRLLDAVVGHPDLDEVEVIELRCREGLVPFYETSGFEAFDPRIEVDGHEEGFVKMNHDG